MIFKLQKNIIYSNLFNSLLRSSHAGSVPNDTQNISNKK
jgi:hypothetical protein